MPSPLLSEDDPFADLIREQVELSRRIRRTETKETPIYQTGTWSPTLAGSTTPGTFTYDATNTGGQYTRIGNRCFHNGRIRITAAAVAPVGDLRINGLPFTSASPTFAIAGGGSVGAYQALTLPAGYTQVMINTIAGVTFINITRGGSAVAQANVQGGELVIVSSFDIRWEGQYKIA